MLITRELLTKVVCDAIEYKWIYGSEVCMGWSFSVKSDIFSFGVLLLKIVTGQKNNQVQTNE